MNHSVRVSGLALALLAASCGAHGGSGDFNLGCTAGQTQSCTCEGTGATGTQSCGASLQFDACVCEGVDAGTSDLGSTPLDVAIGIDRGTTNPSDVVVGIDRGTAPLDTGTAPGPGAFGATCTRLADCASGVCLPSGRCSRSCGAAGDCPTSIGWACASLPGLGAVCNCSPRGAETCNGLDDDCNGVADDGLPHCGGSCVDFSTDPLNCGACGHACASGQRCNAGSCTTTAVCPATCSASAQCSPCRAPTDPAGSGYCCLSGVCVFSMSGSCVLDSGLPDIPGLGDTSGADTSPD